MNRFRAMGRSLAHRNFRLFFFGQGLSLIGTWMQQVALIWLAYRLSHSALFLGLVGFASQVPAALIAPYAGVMTDRWNRQRTVFIAQFAAMVQAFLLAALTITGAICGWQVLLLSIFAGLVTGFDVPARQSFLVQMVDDRTDLANAIALNSSMFNAARLVGPALAGVMIPLLGEWPCFLINGLSYVAVLISLAAMRIRPVATPRRAQGIVAGLKEGFRYVWSSPAIRMVLLLLGLVNMMSMPTIVLLPLVAGDVLHGGAATLGLLTAALGIGALGASLYLAARRSVLGLGSVIAWMSGAFGVGMVLLSLSHSVWLSAMALLGVGFAMIAHMAASNTILQTIVEEDKRGRLMSFYTLAFVGTSPLGSLLGGFLASRLGPLAAIQFCGIACIGGSLVFAYVLPSLRRSVRPIYIRIGVLKASAEQAGLAMRGRNETAIPLSHVSQGTRSAA
ncbi:MAG: MFS transporter [Planctomycetaceae bacterium]|nr:MFS transporter [Planctomycetaceae bacterium]